MIHILHDVHDALRVNEGHLTQSTRKVIILLGSHIHAATLKNNY